jgi:hypothetical protein
VTTLSHEVSVPIPLKPSPGTQGQVTDDEARVMLRAVLSLFDKWEISKADRLTLLGGVSDRTFQRWRAGEIGPLSLIRFIGSGICSAS